MTIPKARFTRLETSFPVRSYETSLARLEWVDGRAKSGLWAIFNTSEEDPDRSVSVRFDRVLAFRVVRTPIYEFSAEFETEGEEPGGFAYEVKGSAFLMDWANMAALVEATHKRAPRHFAFVHDDGVLDVVSVDDPKYEEIVENRGL